MVNILFGIVGFLTIQGNSLFVYQEKDVSRFSFATSWEVLRFLLSNLRWYMEEYLFDGFRYVRWFAFLY